MRMFHRFSTSVWFLAFLCTALLAVFSFRFFDVQAVEAAADFTVGSVNPVSAQEGVAPTPKFYTEVSVG